MGGLFNFMRGNWKGDKVKYSGIHQWLYSKFGKASMCESLDCKGRSNNYNWAKLKGVKYERKRENFWQLCISCHRKYDGVKANKGSFKKGDAPPAHRKPCSCFRCNGVPWNKGLKNSQIPWNKGLTYTFKLLRERSLS